jgi:hypothetical protein
VTNVIVGLEIRTHILENSCSTPPNAATPVPFWARGHLLMKKKKVISIPECPWVTAAAIT